MWLSAVFTAGYCAWQVSMPASDNGKRTRVSSHRAFVLDRRHSTSRAVWLLHSFIYGSASQVFLTLICGKFHHQTQACAAALTWRWQLSSLWSPGGDECKLRHEADSAALQPAFTLGLKSLIQVQMKTKSGSAWRQVWLPPHPPIIGKGCVFAAELKVDLLMMVSLPTCWDEWLNEQIRTIASHLWSV